VDQPLPPAPPSSERNGGAEELLRRLRRDRGTVRRYRRIQREPEGPERSHARLRLATGWFHAQLLSMALERLRAGNGPMLGRIGDSLGMAAGAAGLALPYLSASFYHAGEGRHAQRMAGEFFPGDLGGRRPARALMLTDTFDELNGVAGTMRRLADHAARDPGLGVTVVACRDKAEEAPGLVSLAPLGRVEVPAYGDPEWRMGVPPLLELLAVVERSGANVIHAATPGPMGLCALLLAKVLGLPFAVTYHTELARYAMDLTGDRVAADLTDRAVRWFYGQAERVYVPSRATGRQLAAQGVEASRLELFTRGIDTELFSPARRSERMRRWLGGQDATVLLYVGRLSREKGVLRLAEAYRAVGAQRPQLCLAVVGEGPGRPELERALAGTRHRLLGPLSGEALAAAYASADLFCLPSVTETFGQVILEAGASGLPAVVMDVGGAAESVQHGLTGMVARAADPDDLAWTLARLVDDPALRERLGRRARSAMRARPTWDEVFRDLASSYGELGESSPAVAAARRAAPWGVTA
jgi:glycosyltransferase involved in cell wall biosynthesis